MGKHSKLRPEHGKAVIAVSDALMWAARNKRTILGALVILLPLVSRFVPGFPADEILSALRAFLGA